MNDAANTSVRPSWGRIAAIVLIGPVIGVLTILALITLFEPTGDFSALTEYLMPVLGLGWVLGLIPSVLAAGVYFYVYPRLAGPAQRIWAVLGIGAIAGLVGIWPAIWMLFGVMRADLPFSLMAAGAGAIALLATATPFAPKS